MPSAVVVFGVAVVSSFVQLARHRHSQARDRGSSALSSSRYAVREALQPVKTLRYKCNQFLEPAGNKGYHNDTWARVSKHIRPSFVFYMLNNRCMLDSNLMFVFCEQFPFRRGKEPHEYIHLGTKTHVLRQGQPFPLHHLQHTCVLCTNSPNILKVLYTVAHGISPQT